MKSLHFCTPWKLDFIKMLPDKGLFHTIRTGWIPSLYQGDIIQINERIIKGHDIPICKAKITHVEPCMYKDLWSQFPNEKEEMEEEIRRYGRKFHKNHYFFRIILRKIVSVSDIS